MQEIEFKGKRYPVRTFFELRGDDWLNVALTMENGIGSPDEIVAAVQSCLSVFVPSAAKRMRSWPAQDIVSFGGLVYSKINSGEGEAVMQRCADSFKRMGSVLQERYCKSH